MFEMRTVRQLQPAVLSCEQGKICSGRYYLLLGQLVLGETDACLDTQVFKV